MTTSPARPACDVCLVNMPFVALERPSLAIGLLRASAAAAGLCAHGVHPSFQFAEQLGPALYSRVLHCAPDQNIGDWLFAGAAFPDESARHAAFVEQLDKRRVASWLCVRPQALEAILWQLRTQAEALVDRTARLIVGTGARIVGCSSVFQQQVASLALLRTVKALDPSIQTMLGGANCEAQMGAAVHRSFDWVDYVVSGEADLLFGELCVRILAEDAQLDTTLPSGVLGPAHRGTGPPSGAHGSSPGRAALHDLDASHLPEFDDYFTALGQSSLRTSIHPALLVETARGCWWGEKHHCTFCGLNGDDMRYRPKSSARVIEEFAYLTARYATHRLLVVDNILHQQHLATVVPALIEAGAPYSIFYETKANLSAQQIEQLSRAGVRRVQPGFESLHLGALELLNKGTTPVINLQYLKTARWLATFVTWNFLWEIPGESWAWYAGIADWLPLVSHLQPPNTLCAVRFDRFSPYQQQPAAYGLDLRPGDGLGCIYPVDATSLNDLAYYFTDQSRPVELALRRFDPGIRRFEVELDRWMNLWDRIRRADPAAPPVPSLVAHRTTCGLEISDTRPIARERRFCLAGLDAQVLEQCDSAPSRAALARRLRACGVAAGDSSVDAALARLVERSLVLSLDDRLLALPTHPQQQAYLAIEEYPGGHFALERAATAIAREIPPAELRAG